jgi:hypothetical protein
MALFQLDLMQPVLDGSHRQTCKQHHAQAAAHRAGQGRAAQQHDSRQPLTARARWQPAVVQAGGIDPLRREKTVKALIVIH